MKTAQPYRLNGHLRANLIGAMLLLGAMVPAQAQCLSSGEARQAVQSGHAIAPGQVAAAVSRRGAKLVDLQLCQGGSGYVYLLRVVTKRGRVREITVDARSGAVSDID